MRGELFPRGVIVNNSRPQRGEPVVSIITAAYNVGKDIQKTIDSIRGQSASEIEWIIVDGGSNDESVPVYRANTDVIDLCISERDSGIYNAWNKGLKYVRGEWVIFIGAGDCFASANTLKHAIGLLRAQPSEVGFAYGGVRLVAPNWHQIVDGEVDLTAWDLGLPALPPHPGVFHRSKLFVGGTPFDESYKIAGDTKFLLSRANDSARFKYLGLVISCMVQGGVSSRPENWSKIKNEKLRIRKELGLIPPPWHTRLQDIKLYLKPIFHLVFRGQSIRVVRFLRRQKAMVMRIVRPCAPSRLLRRGMPR